MRENHLFICLPGGGQNRFFFSGKRKQRFWTPKKKRWTGGNIGKVRCNRALDLCCYGIPWVRDFGVSFCFRRPGFERPVVPFAPLPLSGWNTAPCPLVSTPPGWWFSGGVGGCCPAGSPYGWGVALAGKNVFSFVGKRGVLPSGCFFACPAGAKTAFSFASKRESGSGLRKRKGRPVEILGRYGTTGRWCYADIRFLG